MACVVSGSCLPEQCEEWVPSYGLALKSSQTIVCCSHYHTSVHAGESAFEIKGFVSKMLFSFLIL